MRTLLTFILFHLTVFLFAQTNSSEINNIRKAVNQINKDSGFTIKKLDGEEFLEQVPDNGAELSGYFKNGRLVKIGEWIGLSSCVNVVEYYLQNDKLIFVYVKGSESPYIDSLGAFDRSKLVKTMECRFYFSNDKLIKTALTGATRCGGKPDATLGKDYFDECTRFKKLFTKK